MRILPLLLVLLLPAALARADDDWGFLPAEATLLWGDAALAPQEVGATPEPLVPRPETGAAGGAEIAIEPLDAQRWAVRRLAPGTGAVVWERLLLVETPPPTHGREGVYVSSIAWHPRSAAAAPESAQPALADVVVSLAEGALLAAIDARTGLVRWQVPCVWEHVRSQEPPPNYIMRVLRVRERGARAALRENATVTAGPVVVPHADGYRVFVGVTEARTAETATPLAHSRVYEIDDDGEVIAVAPLPRPFEGGGAWAQDGGAVFTLDAGAVVRVEPSFQQTGGFRGEGDTDRVVRVAWYVEPPPGPAPVRAWDRPSDVAAAGPWLVTHARHEASALAAPWLVSASAGARCLAPTDAAWEFPLRALNLASGRFVEAVLRVPFRGTVPPPAANFSARTLQDGSKRYEAFGAHQAALVGVEQRAGQLVLEVERDGGERLALAFALPGVTPLRAPLPLPPAAPVATDDPDGLPTPVTLEEALSRTRTEPRVADPAAVLAPVLEGDRKDVARLVAVALAGPSPVRNLALARINELDAEAQARIPADALPALMLLLAHGGLSWQGLLVRLAEQDPDRAVEVLAEIVFRAHDDNYLFDALPALERLGVPGHDVLFELAQREASDRSWALYWTSASDDELPAVVRRERRTRWKALLDDPRPRVRAAAAQELWQLGDPEALEGTLEPAGRMLRSSHMLVRRVGAALVATWAERNPEATAALLPDLIDALATPERWTVEAVLSALGRLRERARPALAALRDVALHGERHVRVSALFCLADVSAPHDVETLDVLAEAEADPHPRIAEAAQSARKRLLER